jgi:F0F1-type ATP synthase membrane subunit b/b'
MPVRITSLNPDTVFSEMCETLVVNVHGAGVRSPAALAIATPIRLETADHRTATGWITNFEPLGQSAQWWLLGVALEQPANFWRVPNPPDDWTENLPPVALPPQPCPERKFSVWPGAYGPQQTAPACEAVPHSPPQPPSDPTLLLSRLQTDLEARTEQHWSRLRRELEPQLAASTRGMQQELQESLAAWRAERAAVEGSLKELLAVRDEVSARLASITSMLREQAAPLREEIIAEASAQVNTLISDFQERLGGERQAVDSTQQPLANAVEEQLRTKTDALLQQLRERSAEEIAARAASTMDKLESQLRTSLAQAGGKFHHNFLQELEQRQQAASQAIAGHVEELRTSEAAWRERVHQLQNELSLQSEHALAQLRVQVQELGDKQEEELLGRLKKRDGASEAALQTVGGRILASAREQLQAEAERHRQQLAASRASLHSELERMERHAAEMEARLLEVRQAREYVESLVKALPATIQQHISERVAATIERMSGSAQQRFTSHVENELAALERRVHEVAEQAGASLTGKLAAGAAARDQQEQSGFTGDLSELQAQAAAIRDETARIGKTVAPQQAAVEPADAKLRELAERESMASEREQQLRHLLAQSQKEADVLLRRQASNAAAALQEQLRMQFEEGRKQFDQAQSSALRQLETLQQRAETLTSLVDVELQKHAEALVEESVADAQQRLQATSEAVREAHRAKAEADMAAILHGKLQQGAGGLVAKAVTAAGEQLQTATAALHREQLARAQAELDRLLGGVVQQATDAGLALRQTIETLQQELARTKQDRADIRREVEQAQASLAQQMTQFQGTLHDAFLQASGEIKGRIRQAVEMAEEPLERRSRDIQLQLTAAAQRVAEELQKQFAEARDRLQTAAVATESHAEQALQERLAHAMDTFRQDAESLARRSMERWQTAVNETLAEIPQLLSQKLGVDRH